MAGDAVEKPGASYVVPMALMVSLYFGIGFITTMNDALVAHFKDLFHLTNTLALLVQVCFFGAYFLMSVPSGWIIGRIGYQRGIVAALATMGCGLLVFLPASVLISYPVFLGGLFVVGSGLALLQVAINPYVGVLGAPETAAARLNLCGGLNSLAGTIAPVVGGAFIFLAAGASREELARSVRGPYVVLAAATFGLALVSRMVHLPELIERATAEEMGGGSAWSFRNLQNGAVGIFCYVGAEVSVGSLIIPYLGQAAMGGMSHDQAKWYVSLYWGGAMVGRFVGSYVMSRFRISAARALGFVSVLAMVFLGTAILAHGPVALWALVSCGLFNSVMWPCIFPMSVEGLGRYTSQGSGILITMVVGGAVIPEVQAVLADSFGYQRSFWVVLACYAYLLYFAVSGHKPGGEHVAA